MSLDERTSFPKDKIKILLLENIHTGAKDQLAAQGFSVDLRKPSLSEAELVAAVADVHILGIRSKTHVTPKVVEAGRRLLAIGCFCIGTNQVDLDSANRAGVPVFNAPFSNTRSVAELVLAEVIGLSRQLYDRSREVHDGNWKKVSDGSREVRGKTLGIVGYGHIGSQVGVLAEMIGLRVVFYDRKTCMPHGNNRQLDTLDELLAHSDFVTLHVPATPQTHEMIGPDEIAKMRRGSYLLNLSRGNVVIIDALAAALKSGHIAGAAIDVYPEEPEKNGDPFRTPLQGLPNVILTPHVGGSTEEAQAAIGIEVATYLTKLVNTGATSGAVNFPQVELPPEPGKHRILNVHRNVPGVLRDINRIVSDRNANIHAQVLSTDPNIGYLMMDLDQAVSDEVKDDIAKLQSNIRTRILY